MNKEIDKEVMIIIKIKMTRKKEVVRILSRVIMQLLSGRINLFRQ
jgi:hypothetical protein